MKLRISWIILVILWCPLSPNSLRLNLTSQPSAPGASESALLRRVLLLMAPVTSKGRELSLPG